MGSTYLQLTNEVLQQLNEVSLSSSNFSSATGIHGAAKSAVKYAIQIINSQKFEWPFNSSSGSQVLTVGQEEYSFPSDYKIADWNSFYVEKDDTLNIKTRQLKYLDRDEWYNKYRNQDFDSENDGVRQPIFVFRTPSGGFGISPSPDRAYTVKYNYFVLPDNLSNYNDTTRIPSNFDYVIVSGALVYMYTWRENEQRAALEQDRFERGISNMVSLLINDYSKMRDTVVNFGGLNIRSANILYDV